MRLQSVLAGVLTGSINYALLAAGCKLILKGKKRGAFCFVGGMALAALLLVLFALAWPALLLWAGCAAGGTLVSLSVAHMLYKNIFNRHPLRGSSCDASDGVFERR
jgi:hypothetical protein